MRHRLVVISAMALLFSGMCIIENGAVRARPVEPAGHDASSIYMLAGEFRTVFANLLWVKVEQYHHEYLEKHASWSSNTELLGLLDLITALDPHFVEAYAAGYYIHADGRKDKDGALNYLRQAVVHNPRSWELHRLTAIVYACRMKDPERALPHARLALKYCDDQFYAGVVRRLVNTLEQAESDKKLGTQKRRGGVQRPENRTSNASNEQTAK